MSNKEETVNHKPEESSSDIGSMVKKNALA